MSIVVGILVIVVGIAVSIALHEVGHMAPAKRFGVRVSQYMVGFGPTIWSRTRGETEYGIKAIPLGGYVRMVGMMPAAPDGARRGRGFFAQVVADARDQSVEEIRPGEEHRAFYHLSTPKKLVVMLGGPTMNLLLAVVLTASFMAIGFTQQTTTVASVSECVPTATGAPCDPAAAPAPAVAAGLRAGDRIVSYDGVATGTWRELLDAISGTAGQPVPLVVERDGQQVTLTVTPVDAERAVLDADGVVVRDPDGDVATVSGAFVGFAPTLARQSIPLSQVPSEVGRMFTGTARAVFTFPVRVYEAAAQTFTDTPRSADSVMSVVGVGRAAADVAGLDATVLDRVAIMLSLLASLNMALFVFNLIPLLPLDGGHVVNALYEGAKRTVARVRGLRPLPGPADVARMMPVAYVMFVVLIGATLLLVVADVVDPVQIF
ncbi:M50 family metallopeptidase [Xylanimonas ulmi]|uniref:RIP metalloprotease RseP n=1 Tax=Xylanimonas ulmi TaxID=228973 RepID=A0A4Q7M3E9_9MICO|nr:site-2 protease family protein [Xylanibacterium ulmi]RZS61387.1 RIP metalloprotease RseP [Xylanibacterium ulmi]